MKDTIPTCKEVNDTISFTKLSKEPNNFYTPNLFCNGELIILRSFNCNASISFLVNPTVEIKG